MGLFGGKKETDPVCKMKVDPKTARYKYDFERKTYYFCGPGCLDSFKAEPKKYLAA